MSLSQETVKAIKETVPLVREKAEEVTTRMYEILFTKYPQTKEMFVNAQSDQHKKLAGAITAFDERYKKAWSEAYGFLGDILMKREQELYAQN